MGPVDLANAREFLEAIVAASSVLGGGMAYFSGYNSAQSLAQDQPPDVVAHCVNEGPGRGFEIFSPLSIFALFVMVLS